MTCKVRLTPTDVTFVIAVGTAIMLTTPHGVRMTFAIYTVVMMTVHTVMMITAAVTRYRILEYVTSNLTNVQH
jgi:hypothetical protein